MLTFSDDRRFNLSITISLLKFGLPMVRGSSQSACFKPRKTPPTPCVGMHRLGWHFMCKGSVYWQVDWFVQIADCGVICSQWDVLSCSKTCTYLLNRYISRFHGHGRNIILLWSWQSSFYVCLYHFKLRLCSRVARIPISWLLDYDDTGSMERTIGCCWRGVVIQI